jgi:hypothetical protein
VQVDLNYLRGHYASLSDEALAAVDRTQLVDAAQKCYDEECARRAPARAPSASARPRPIEQIAHLEDGGGKPRWLEGAICVCAFVDRPGTHNAPDAEAAVDALQAAGIPCYIDMHETQADRPGAQPQTEYGVLVPGPLNLKALSVLDQEIWNPRFEAEWKAHFAELSDEELAELDPEVLCAGLANRIERLRKAYEEEVARRKAEQPGR